jgi:hypothetical protein
VSSRARVAASRSTPAGSRREELPSSRNHHQQSFPTAASRGTNPNLDPGCSKQRTAKHVRRWAYGLLDGLRPVSSTRISGCRRRRISLSPYIVVRQDGRAHFGGILQCGSVHACPACSLVIKTKRGVEVRTVVERHCEKHGRETAYLVSATVRHDRAHDLKAVRRGLAAARQRMRQGRWWVKFRQASGYVGEVNAVEVTHGTQHGWHPHHHSVMLFARSLSVQDEHRLKERWIECVEAALGSDHRPDYEHGLDVRRCEKADYLAKLGLELTEAMGAKRAKSGHRSSMQIAEDFSKIGRAEDGRLWSEYAAAMFGCRQLNWSRNIRELYGLGAEQSDEQLAEEDQDDEPSLVDFIEGPTWDAVRDLPQAKTFILEAAETGGREAVGTALESLRNDPGARWPKVEEVANGRRPFEAIRRETALEKRCVGATLPAPPFADRLWRSKHRDALAWTAERIREAVLRWCVPDGPRERCHPLPNGASAIEKADKALVVDEVRLSRGCGSVVMECRLYPGRRARIDDRQDGNGQGGGR